MSVTKADLGSLLGQMVGALNREFDVAKEYETAPSAAVLNTAFALIKHFDITPDVDDAEAKALHQSFEEEREAKRQANAARIAEQAKQVDAPWLN